MLQSTSYEVSPIQVVSLLARPPRPTPHFQTSLALFLVFVMLWSLHIGQGLAILPFLRLHAHACHDESRDAAGDTEAPVNAGIHGGRMEVVGQ